LNSQLIKILIFDIYLLPDTDRWHVKQNFPSTIFYLFLLALSFAAGRVGSDRLYADFSITLYGSHNTTD